jgi:hypothetical protein
MKQTKMTVKSHIVFNGVHPLGVPSNHNPTAPQECEASMWVCSVGLRPATGKQN